MAAVAADPGPRLRWRALALRCAMLLAAAGVAGLSSGFAAAQPVDDSQAPKQQEREQIEGERKRVEADFAAREAQCFQRFAVNDCLKESRAGRRDALAVLRRREIEINDAERRRKAAEQRQRIAERVRARKDAAAPADAATAWPGGVPKERAATVQPLVPHRAADARGGRSTRRPMAPRREPDTDDAGRRRADAGAKRAERATEAEQNAARHEQKLREAAQHKAKVLQEDAGRQKPAKPLPVVPPAAVVR